MNLHFPEIANLDNNIEHKHGNACFITEIKIFSGRGITKKQIALFTDENKLDIFEYRKTMCDTYSCDTSMNPCLFKFMEPHIKLNFEIKHLDTLPILCIQRIDLVDTNKIIVNIVNDMQIFYDITYYFGYEDVSNPRTKKIVIMYQSHDNSLISIQNNNFIKEK